ncbi:N utilization substance protein B [Pontiella desulfatans]|uniref:Transcription antitermination protein NusB n=1 Tax=Pontiella desulfatans TaxID=2750659 RepID=A0A6C2U5S6_PONDE|nr:transcription antitermination factor NusB [Pontiella desulfatans]VGO15199.1 N utilization substance protein B [Pontiella desulfatans]
MKKKLNGRRQTREWIMQFLFQLDFNPEPIDIALQDFWEEKEPSEKEKSYAEEIIKGVVQRKAELDERLSVYAKRWNSDRMGAVDRTVMRVALFEMLHREDVPPIVSINEAVHFAKDFSSFQSGRFVNGVLDRIRKDIDRPARTTYKPRGSE